MFRLNLHLFTQEFNIFSPIDRLRGSVYYARSPFLGPFGRAPLSQAHMTTPSLPPALRVDADIRNRYAALLEANRRTESTDPAANRHPWQCEIAVTQLSEFALAKQHQARASHQDPVVVRVRTDSMPLRVYDGGVANLLREFIDLGGELRILLTASKTNYDVSSIQRYRGVSNVQLRQEQPTDLGSTFGNHFFVVGEQAYRYEAAHIPFSGDEFRATDDFHPIIPARICFNDPVSAESLTHLFDVLWTSAKEIPVLAQNEGDVKRERGSAESSTRAVKLS